MKFPQSSSFCLSSFMTDLEIITPAPYAVPCIDLAQGTETPQKTRQGGMAKLLCGNPSCGRKLPFDIPWLQCWLHRIKMDTACFFHFHLISYSSFILPIWKKIFNQNVIDISLLVVSNLRNIAFKLYAVQTAILDISSSNWFSVAL